MSQRKSQYLPAVPGAMRGVYNETGQELCHVKYYGTSVYITYIGVWGSVIVRRWLVGLNAGYVAVLED